MILGTFLIHFCMFIKANASFSPENDAKMSTDEPNDKTDISLSSNTEVCCEINKHGEYTLYDKVSFDVKNNYLKFSPHKDEKTAALKTWVSINGINISKEYKNAPTSQYEIIKTDPKNFRRIIFNQVGLTDFFCQFVNQENLITFLNIWKNTGSSITYAFEMKSIKKGSKKLFLTEYNPNPYISITINTKGDQNAKTYEIMQDNIGQIKIGRGSTYTDDEYTFDFNKDKKDEYTFDFNKDKKITIEMNKRSNEKSAVKIQFADSAADAVNFLLHYKVDCKRNVFSSNKCNGCKGASNHTCYFRALILNKRKNKMGKCDGNKCKLDVKEASQDGKMWVNAKTHDYSIENKYD